MHENNSRGFLPANFPVSGCKVKIPTIHEDLEIYPSAYAPVARVIKYALKTESL